MLLPTTPVEVDLVELRRVALPLRTPFRSSQSTTAARDALLVRVRTLDGVAGWGECVAMAEPTYTSEYVEGAEDVLARHLLPRLLDAGPLGAADVAERLRPFKGHRMAKAAVEVAVLDAQLRRDETTLAHALGGVRDSVAAGVSIGIPAGIDELIEVVGGHLAEGYRRIKLKVQPGWDVEPVRAVRERFGDIALQVDANGAYSLADAEHIAALDPFGLLLVEQPLAEDDLDGHAELARRISTPICLDESITSGRAAERAIAAGAAAVINVKAGRVGGYLEAVRIHDLCLAAGVPVWCGGMLETGIGRAANVALASLPGFTLPGDLSASDRYFHRDVTRPFALEDGCLRVPTGWGIGVEPDERALAELTTSVREISRRR